MRCSMSMVVASLALLGCWEGPTLPEGFGVCEAEELDESVAEDLVDDPSYHRDVRPILEAACTGCHSQGGIGPFALDNYADARSFGPLLLAAVDAGTMPPWPPSTCCAPLRHVQELSRDQRAIIERWLELDAPEGDPAEAPPAPPAAGLSRVDVEVVMAEPYTPSATIGDSDDSRCFLIDWPEELLDELDEGRFVTGLEVVPGRRELVHHAIVYAVPEGQLGYYENLDEGSKAPGWSCPGGVLQSADSYLGGWVPGNAVRDFPAGLGREVRRSGKILLNIHYELSAGAAPDQTAVRMKLDAAVDTPVEGLAVMDPTWLVGKSMMIPAGEEDVVHGYAYDPATWTNFGQKIEVHNVSLHMHEFGTTASLAILRADGSVDCLLHIEDWDFDWQGEYWLEQPVTLRFGDRIYIECHFDNSAANQPDGEAPRDQWWGDDKEMCFGSMLVAR